MAESPNYLPPRFETFEEASERRGRLTGQLRREGSRPALALARQLENCERGARCERDPCAVCKRLWRKWLLREAHELLGDEQHILRASIIPRGGRIAVGQLADFDLRRFAKNRQKALQRALPDGLLAFGGIDISWNTEENEDGHWQAHLYLLVFASDSPALRRRIKSAFPSEPTAKRPYRFDEVPRADFANVASYAVKADLYWRSGFLADNGHHHTNSFKLKPTQAVEAALFRDRHAIGSRLLMKGLKRYQTSDGWVLKREQSRPLAKAAAHAKRS